RTARIHVEVVERYQTRLAVRAPRQRRAGPGEISQSVRGPDAVARGPAGGSGDGHRLAGGGAAAAGQRGGGEHTGVQVDRGREVRGFGDGVERDCKVRRVDRGVSATGQIGGASCPREIVQTFGKRDAVSRKPGVGGKDRHRAAAGRGVNANGRAVPVDGRGQVRGYCRSAEDRVARPDLEVREG